MIKWLHRTYQNTDSRSYQAMHLFLNLVIIGAMILGAMETVESVSSRYESAMERAELVIVVIFTFDYVANILTAPNTRKYLFSFWGIVDLLAILPSLLMMGNITALKSMRSLRVLRVMRVLRVLKLARQAVERLRTGKPNSNMLGMNLVIYALALFSVLIISSTLEYYAEYTNGEVETVAKAGDGLLRFTAPDLRGDLSSDKVVILGHPTIAGTYQVKSWNVEGHTFDVAVGDNAGAMQGITAEPIRFDASPKTKVRWAKDTPFNSVPQAMWWCVVTLTTVGYGDMYPVTFWGRIIASITMLCGLILFGMLMGLVGKTMNVVLFGTPHVGDHPENDPKVDGEEDEVDWDPEWRFCPTCGKPHGVHHEGVPGVEKDRTPAKVVKMDDAVAPEHPGLQKQ